MIKRDFHGWLLKDAEHEVHLIIGRVRSEQTSEDAEFITGHGVIKKAIQEILHQYGIPDNKELCGNGGVIKVHIE